MIARYSVAEIDAVFSETGKMSRWLEIELAVLDAMASLGLAPREAADFCRTNAPVIDDAFVARVEAREAVTNHDVAAFVDTVQESIGTPHGTWIHYGLTSTDVVDTGLCWAMRDSARIIGTALDTMIGTLHSMADRHVGTAMIGRTHGVHAEPTTFGNKLALFGLQFARDRERFEQAAAGISVCKLSGAVGTFSNIPPDVERIVGERLGLAPVPATQVVARDRHAAYMNACASIATTIESLAVELRHLQRTEVNEVREGFAAGQKGSSAMPHKRNPISSETLTGLSRVVRANAQVAMQNVPLWHERDISHSSAERIVIPDTVTLVVHMLRRAARLVENLEVDADRMRHNLDSLNGVVFSQSVLLAMVESGMARDTAYRIVQSAARTAIESGTSLRSVLESDPSVTLDAGRLDAAFDLVRVLRHAGRANEALAAVIASHAPVR